VAHSLGGFTAPLACARVSVHLLVLVAGMVPTPGETGQEWWVNTGYEQALPGQDADEDPIAVYYHHVPQDLATESLATGRHQSGTPMLEPWPLEAWPDVPTRYLLRRDDRVFRAEFIRRLVRERLGIAPDEIDGGHYPLLSRPTELAERLEGYRAGLSERR
jgi:pimeloyl-ACP methyl ester carboxylesterase